MYVDLARQTYIPELEGLASDATNYYNISAFSIMMMMMMMMVMMDDG